MATVKPTTPKPTDTRITPPPRQQPDPTREMLIVVLKGLLAGGLVGLLIITTIGVLIFLR